MASAIAHEINQPLSAIANYLKGSRMLLGREEVPRERVAEAVERAATEALRAGDIIRRLREFVARGETERTVESLPKLVEEASALALVGAREHDIRVRFVFDPAVELVLADKVQIQQVVLNLVRNAVDALAESGRAPRELEVRIDREGDMARVGVTDNGPGIAPTSRRGCSSPSSPASAPGWGGPLHLAHDRRGAWRQDLGRGSLRRRRAFQLHVADGGQEGTGRWRVNRSSM